MIPDLNQGQDRCQCPAGRLRDTTMLHEQEAYFRLLNNTLINVKNLEFREDGLKYLGCSDKLKADLENRIMEQPREFSLPLSGDFNMTGMIKDGVDSKLDFRKSDQTDTYFLNRYQPSGAQSQPILANILTF